MGKTEVAAQRVQALVALLQIDPAKVPAGKDLADVVKARLRGIGVTDTCERCGGGGHYSFNPKDGTTCFGCSGRGEYSADVTKPRTYERAEEAVNSGALANYLVMRRAVAEASAAIRPLVREIEATLRPIWNAYESSYKANFPRRDIPAGLRTVNQKASHIYYGRSSNTPLVGKTVTEVEFSVKMKRLCPDYGALFAAQILRELLEEAKAVRAEFEALPK